MLKILTELDAVSGNEYELSDFILSQVSNYADEVIRDYMGNLIFYKKGKKPNGKKIGVFAHMDEVGLIVKSITDDGYIKFDTVGGIDDRILLSQKVSVGPDKICGVIGTKAIHLQSKSEKKAVPKVSDLYIDIGAQSKEDAMQYVNKGDYIAFKSEYVRLHHRRFKAKAIDDRVGCAIMMELIREKYDSDIYFCFTVQEETGLRGATVLARKINPDTAIVLEATTAGDTAFSSKHLYATVLGNGPVISIMDNASYGDRDLRVFIENVAKSRGIKYQHKLTSNGGNDAGAIQSRASGCKVCSVSLPCRYIHSAVSVADGGDYDEMRMLVRAVLNDIGEFEPNEVSESEADDV